MLRAISPFPSVFKRLEQQTPENQGKEEIAHNKIIVSPFVHIFDIISLFAAELEEPKIGMSDKGLILMSLKTLNWSFRAISPFPSVFRSLEQRTRENQGLFGKGLHCYLTTKFQPFPN